MPAVESTVWPDAQIQGSSVDGGVLRQTPTCSTIPTASQAVRVAEREFPCARPTFADPSGSDSDALLVSRGRFAALSDDMTVLVGAWSRQGGQLQQSWRGEPHQTVEDVPGNDSSSPTRVFGRDSSIRQGCSRCAQKTFQTVGFGWRQP